MNRSRSLVALGLVALGCGGNAFETTDDGKSAGSGGSPAAESGGRGDPGTGRGGAGSGGTLSSRGGAEQGGSESAGAETGGILGRGGAVALGGGLARGGSGAGKGGASSGGVNAGGKAGAASGGSPSGTGGSPEDLSCPELQSRYRELLVKARSCVLGSPDPCNVRIAQDPFCGCSTFVSRDNAKTIEQLNEILEEASERTCQVACSAIACFDPVSASCQPMASTGAALAYSCQNGLVTD